MSNYTDFKNLVLNPPRIIGDGQCVSLVVNNSNAYIEHLYPGVSWPAIIEPVEGAREMANKGNGYLQWIENDHSNPNQLPEQGDIMVFGATPADGFENPYTNPYGHTGICDSADSSGYNLLQQNAPASGQVANVTRYGWLFRPCLGWYHPIGVDNPAPAPTPAPEGHTITLPKTTGPWHLYNVGGPYYPSSAKGLLRPDLLGRDLTYDIVENLGNGIYVIDSRDYGRGAIWTNGSYVIVQ